MNKLFILAIIFIFGEKPLAQSGFPKYYAFYALWQKGDSCFAAKNYSKAAEYLNKAANAEIEQGIDVPRTNLFYYAATAYALAGKKKQTFQRLHQIAFEQAFNDIHLLRTDSSFLTIRHQKEWKIIENKIQENYQTSIAQEKKHFERTTFDNPSNEVIFYPHPSSFIHKILSQDTLPFISISHEQYRVFFSADSYAAQHLPTIKKQISEAFSTALRIIDTTAYNRGITLIFFNSVAEMKAVTGVRAMGGIAYAEFDAGLFPITATRRPQFKHEIFHIISLNTWGPSTSRLLIEGSAVYADNECHFENPILTVNAHYLQSNQLVPLNDLIHHFDEIAFKNDVLAYLQSAGIFKYLYEQYGVEKIKKLWVNGFENFQTIYGFSVQQLETDWLNFIKTVVIPEDFDADKLKDGCG